MISKPSRHCTVELHALPSRIGQVRRIISAQLRSWRLDPLVDLAALGVTELLTNVHRHAQPDKRCIVDVEHLLDGLRVSVSDHDPRVPCVNHARMMDTRGRGLALIAAVSDSWGVSPRGETGKCIWFTLPVPPAFASAPPPCPVYGAMTLGPFAACGGPDPAALSYEHPRARSALAG